MEQPPFKKRIYDEVARMGQALASEARLELLDLLVQAPRHVEALANETGMSVANTSQHLQVLRRTRLVETERQGTRVLYRLASGVFDLWMALQETAAIRLPELAQIVREDPLAGARDELFPRECLDDSEEVYVIDVRPKIEYEHGHLPGAASLPLEELPAKLDELPRNRPIVAYCRGVYCLTADEAVVLLRREGFEAYRLEGGWPEWLAALQPAEG